MCTPFHRCVHRYAWWGAYTYDWDQFMVAAGASVAGMLIWGIPKYILKKHFNIDGPGISGLLMRIPGYRFLAGRFKQHGPRTL